MVPHLGAQSGRPVRVPYKCLRCGLVNPMGLTTCQACGASLTGALPAATKGIPPSAHPSRLTTHSTQSTPGSQGTLRKPQTTSIATAVVSSSLAPGAFRLSALGPFGWKFLDGRVIQVEPLYMGTPDSRWVQFLVKLAILGAAVHFYGALLLVLLVVFAGVAWLVAKVFRGGFLSAVAVQVTSFMLTRRLLGPVANVPVRDIRLRDGNGQETLVRIKGQLISGSVTVGDDVHVEGWERGGMLLFRRGYNNRIRAAIQVRRT